MVVRVAGSLIILLALVVLAGTGGLWKRLPPLRRAGFLIVALGFLFDGVPWMAHGDVTTLAWLHSTGTALSVGGLAALLLSDAREFARLRGGPGAATDADNLSATQGG